MREHDDDISNPMRAHSGRWTVFLFEMIGAFFILGAVTAAIPYSESVARSYERETLGFVAWLSTHGVLIRLLMGLVLLLPWLLLRIIGRDRPGLRLLGSAWLALVLVISIILLVWTGLQIDPP